MKKGLGTALRIIAWLAVALAVAGGGYWFWLSKKPKPPTYKTATVARATISSQVTATGTVSALVTVAVGAQVSGRVTEIRVDYNANVKKGDILAKIDQQPTLAQIAQADAQLMQAKGGLEHAKASLAIAQVTYDRTVALFQQQLAGQADVDTAQAALATSKADITSAKGQLASSEASLNQQRISLGFTTIYSPIDGTVISRAVDVGQTVASSLQTPTLFTIAQDLRKMQVDTSVAEADVGKLKATDPASFTVDAYTNEPFVGTVRQIRNVATTVQNVVTYDAVIDVPNPELKLKPGMTATVRFEVERRENVIAVPAAALRFHPDGVDPAAAMGPTPHGSSSAYPHGSGGRHHGGGDGTAAPDSSGGVVRDPSASKADKTSTAKVIYVLRDGQPAPVRVHVGLSDGVKTEITSGDLKEGDEVITDAVAASTATTTKAPTGASPLGGTPAPAGGRRGGF